jgi:hypothetical protein
MELTAVQLDPLKVAATAEEVLPGGTNPPKDKPAV